MASPIKKTDNPEFTGPELATILNLSTARISQLTADGTILRAKSKKYPLSAITDYIRWLKRTNPKPKPESKLDGLKLEEQRALLTAEQLREKKRDNDLADGLIAPISDITDTIVKVGSIIMSNLESLPGRMKRANPELTAHDINIVKKTISKCCQAISEMKEDVD